MPTFRWRRPRASRLSTLTGRRQGSLSERPGCNRYLSASRVLDGSRFAAGQPVGFRRLRLVARLTLEYLQHRPDANIPLAAASREQAEHAYRQAEGFVIRTPWMQSVFECQPGYRRITLRSRPTSRLQVIAADDRTGDGTI